MDETIIKLASMLHRAPVTSEKELTTDEIKLVIAALEMANSMIEFLETFAKQGASDV